MKFLETTYEEYINKCKDKTLHPPLEKLYQKLPVKSSELMNIIFYGPPGVGKYTQALVMLSQYSPTCLKYEKRVMVSYNKQQYFYKISDIHFEVDMSLLGCNSKLLWNEIYTQFVDIINTKANKIGFLVCKNFHSIHHELLDIFYSYMQKQSKITIKFIILSESVSFIPTPIINACHIIHVPRPSKSQYKQVIGYTENNVSNISNIKLLSLGTSQIKEYDVVIKKLIAHIDNVKQINIIALRETIYDIFIYNLDVVRCIYIVLQHYIQQDLINDANVDDIIIEIYSFLHLYNNNYRPIYHIEGIILSIIKSIHKI